MAEAERKKLIIDKDDKLLHAEKHLQESKEEKKQLMIKYEQLQQQMQVQLQQI